MNDEDRLRVDDDPPIRVVSVDYRYPSSARQEKREGWVLIIMLILAALKGIKVL